jgi:hypothetical protein
VTVDEQLQLAALLVSSMKIALPTKAFAAWNDIFMVAVVLKLLHAVNFNVSPFVFRTL